MLNWLKLAQKNNENFQWEASPEIFEHLNMPHDSIYHTESILEHTEAVVNFTMAIDYSSLFPELSSEQQESVKKILFTAAMLHDIGKPATRAEKYKFRCDLCGTYNNKPNCQCGNEDTEKFRPIKNFSYHQHELESSNLADKYLQGVSYPYKEVIRSLIKNHMITGTAIGREQNYKALNKMILKLHKTYNNDLSWIKELPWLTAEVFLKMAIAMSTCDHLARISPADPPHISYNNRLKEFGETDQFEELQDITHVPQNFGNIVNKYIFGTLTRYQQYQEENSAKKTVEKRNVNIGEKTRMIQEFLESNGLHLQMNENMTRDELFQAIKNAGKTNLIQEVVALLK